jgi:hypothetical protein
MATPSAINVAPSGSAPVATYQQTQGSSLVQVQQMAIVDPNGTGAGPIGTTVDSNGLYVVLQQGAPKFSGPLYANIANGSNALLIAPAITVAFTGTLQHAYFCATFSAQWLISAVNNSSVSTGFALLMSMPGETVEYRAVMNNEFATVKQTGTATLFQVQCTNVDLQTGDAYASFFWAEN